MKYFFRFSRIFFKDYFLLQDFYIGIFDFGWLFVELFVFFSSTSMIFPCKALAWERSYRDLSSFSLKMTVLVGKIQFFLLKSFFFQNKKKSGSRIFSQNPKKSAIKIEKVYAQKVEMNKQMCWFIWQAKSVRVPKAEQQRMGKKKFPSIESRFRRK